MIQDDFSQTLRLGFCILATGLALYLADVFYFAPRRIPPCVQESLPPGHICPQELLRTWKKNSAGGQGYKIVWVDARSESDYELHHLMMDEDRAFPIRPGVDMQQLMDAAIERLIDADNRGECIVVFCTESCSSSEEIAQAIRDTGLVKAPVYVLEGGWPTLLQTGIVPD